MEVCNRFEEGTCRMYGSQYQGHKCPFYGNVQKCNEKEIGTVSPGSIEEYQLVMNQVFKEDIMTVLLQRERDQGHEAFMQMDAWDVNTMLRMKANRQKQHMIKGTSTKDDLVDIIGYCLMELARQRGLLK